MNDNVTLGKKYHELKALIDTDSKKEHECREYLQYVKYLLFKETTIYKHGLDAREYRGHSGDLDYVVSGSVWDEGGFECVRVYIWELKAPQCFIYEIDNKNKTRLRPTKDLYSAENQLIHYYHEQKGSRAFRDEFNVKADNIKIGGIIIGSQQRLVKGDYDEKYKNTLYERSSTIRRTYFYDMAQIRVMTWSEVLRQFLSTTYVSQSKTFEKQLPAFDIPREDLVASPIRST